ncbi:MAG TPA: hypothetical protein VFT31_03675 [Kribbella sp.]|nr:hypothetical protein [Kribbella sp.]
MNAQLRPSVWTVPEARSLTAQLRHVATTAAEYNGLELFGALTQYLDQLYGGDGFDRLLPDSDRAVMAGLIRRATTGPLALDQDGVPLTAQVDPRLEQPVNAAVSLVEGRRLAAELATADGWQRELGRALQALYSYLDELHGGPGTFAELLTPEERAQIAAAAPNR